MKAPDQAAFANMLLVKDTPGGAAPMPFLDDIVADTHPEARQYDLLRSNISVWNSSPSPADQVRKHSGW